MIIPKLFILLGRHVPSIPQTLHRFQCKIEAVLELAFGCDLRGRDLLEDGEDFGFEGVVCGCALHAERSNGDYELVLAHGLDCGVVFH